MGVLGIFVGAGIPIPVVLIELTHLEVGRPSEKGLWALLAEPLWLWPG